MNRLRTLNGVAIALSRIAETGADSVAIPLRDWARLEASCSKPWSPELRKFDYWSSLNESAAGAMLGYRSMSIGRALQERQALHIDQQTDLPDPSTLTPNAPASPLGLTATDLLESEAHMHDGMACEMWRHAGVSDDLVVEVHEGLSHGPYMRAWEVLGDIFGYDRHARPIDVLLLALHLSFFSPLALTKPFREQIRNWEDVQPCWRFVRSLEALAALTLPERPLEEYGDVCSQVCARLGWSPTPTEIAMECSRALSSRKSYNRISLMAG